MEEILIGKIRSCSPEGVHGIIIVLVIQYVFLLIDYYSSSYCSHIGILRWYYHTTPQTAASITFWSNGTGMDLDIQDWRWRSTWSFYGCRYVFRIYAWLINIIHKLNISYKIKISIVGEEIRFRVVKEVFTEVLSSTNPSLPSTSHAATSESSEVNNTYVAPYVLHVSIFQRNIAIKIF